VAHPRLLFEVNILKAQKSNCKSCCLQVWAVLVDLPVHFSNLSSRQRLLWVVVFCYTLNINVAHKSFITSLLATPVYSQRIVTVTDMIKSDLPVIVSSALPEAVISSGLSRRNYNKLRKRLLFCPAPIHTCLVSTSASQFCVAAFSHDMEFVKAALPNRHFHRLDRKIRTTYRGMYTTKNFFLARKMTTMILRSVEAGLVQLWSKSDVRSKKLCDLPCPNQTLLENSEGSKNDSEHTSVKVVTPFSMTNMHSAFSLLILGLFLAGLVCALEMISVTRVFRDLWTRLEKCRRELRLRSVNCKIAMSRLK